MKWLTRLFAVAALAVAAGCSHNASSKTEAGVGGAGTAGKGHCYKQGSSQGGTGGSGTAGQVPEQQEKQPSNNAGIGGGGGG